MSASRALAILISTLAFCGSAHATTVPTDLALQFTATPNADLHPGDVISFTLSLTNHGPEAVDSFGVYSSPILYELDLNRITTDCDNRLVLAVADLENGFYYVLNWYALGTEDPPTPLQPGDTLTCLFSIPYTQWAPPEFALTFRPPSDFHDLDDSNNVATVVLRGSTAFALTAVPATSPLALILLALLLVGSAGFVWIRT